MCLGNHFILSQVRYATDVMGNVFIDTDTDALCDFVDSLEEDNAQHHHHHHQGGNNDQRRVGESSSATAAETSDGWPTLDADSTICGGGGWPTPAVDDKATLTDTWTTTVAETSDTWSDIRNVFDNWLMCLIDTEQRICAPGKSLKSDRLKQTIDCMLEDGLIDFSDARELRFIGDSWIRLMNSHTLYTTGCRSYRRDIISTLLDLYAARQIDKELCVQICAEL